MPIGPGKYDDFATRVMEETAAAGVVVIVIAGKAGSGFSVQGPLPVQRSLPAMLRFLADQIENDLPAMPDGPAGKA